ncbi:MAG: hypothetical protein ACXQT4_05225 [Methanotrichaceae archaeon]
MYRNIITLCWSIKEVNKNLRDRESMTDYSINYLNKACSDLSAMLTSDENIDPNEKIEVLNRIGQTKKFTISDVAEMLNDAKKIIEFSLIDRIDQWAKSKYNHWPH